MPQQLIGLPVTLVSQALQASMRVQQNVTELAIKGDDVLAALRPVEDAPSWATFDEDQADRPAGDLDVDIADAGPPDADVPPAGPPDVPGVEAPGADVPGEYGTDIGSVTPLDAAARNGRPREDPDPAPGDDDPWAAEQRALSHDYADGTFDSPRESASGPAGIAGYDELSLPQLRARLRQFSPEQLAEILAYERAHANRSQFTGMLSRRIENVRREGDSAPGQDDSER